MTALVCSSAQAVDITLAWDPNVESDLDGYTVYYSKESPGPPYDYAGDLPLSELANPDNPMVTLTDLQERVNYYFALTAYDVNGNESEFSESICIQIDQTAGECTSSPTVVDPPVVTSSGGGSSSGGACFIGAAGHSDPGTNRSAVSKIDRQVMFFLTITALIFAAVAGRSAAKPRPVARRYFRIGKY